MMYNYGQKLVCIDGEWEDAGTGRIVYEGPKKHEVITFGGMSWRYKDFLTLIEYPGYSFGPKAFRPLDDILEEINIEELDFEIEEV